MQANDTWQTDGATINRLVQQDLAHSPGSLVPLRERVTTIISRKNSNWINGTQPHILKGPLLHTFLHGTESHNLLMADHWSTHRTFRNFMSRLY